jgi:hypothetical protein
MKYTLLRMLVLVGLFVMVSCGGGGGSSGGSSSYQELLGIAVDTTVTPHKLYVTDYGQNIVESVSSLSGTGATLTTVASTMSLSGPAGIAINSGNLFVTDTGNDVIREVANVSTNPSISLFAGVVGGSSTNSDYDATTLSADFYLPRAVAFDSFGNMFVADSFNHVIREIVGGTTYTIAGKPGSPGNNTGTGTNAQFNTPSALAVDAHNNIFVVDLGNHAIRLLQGTNSNSPTGTWTVSNFAGTPGTNNAGYQDVATVSVGTPATNAKFNFPFGIAYDGATNLFIADQSNNVIREIAITNSANPVATAITTLAGNHSNTAGFSNDTSNDSGATAYFNDPTGIVYDSTTPSLYVIDQVGTHIRIVNPSNGNTTTLY